MSVHSRGVWLVALLAIVASNLLGATTAAPAAAQTAGAASITGRVTGAEGQPLAGVSVTASGPGFSAAWTDPNGVYTVLGLPAGDYRVYFNPVGSGHVGEWYDDKPDYGSATVVTLVESEQRTGVDAQLTRGASITGRVTGADGQPIAGVSVTVSGPTSGSASTDTDGKYTIVGLLAGEYRIQFTPTEGSAYIGEWYVDKPDYWSADPVTLGASEQHAGVDAELALGASIAGRVTDPDGQPILGVSVVAYGEVTWAYASTDTDGLYRIVGLSAGDYRITFSGMAHMLEWYDDKADEASADVVSVAAGDQRTGIDAQLAPRAAIRGRVTDQAGQPLAGVLVTAYGQWVAGAYTDADGNYAIVGLPAGDWRVSFSGNQPGFAYIGEWYNDKADSSSADVVTLGVSEQRGGVDAQLAPLAAISGRVTGVSGEPLAGALVFAIGPQWASAFTDTDGHYSIVGLVAGDYRVSFSHPVSARYAGEYYDDKLSFETADLVTLATSEQRAGIDALLNLATSISGHVTDVEGHPIAGVFVTAQGPDFKSAYTDTDGNYAIVGLLPGDYRIAFNPWNSRHVTEWYDDKPTWDTADVVTLARSEQRTGVDAQLAQLASISGRVTDAAGQPIAGVSVEVGGPMSSSAWTDSEGRYAILGLLAGDYRVQFTPPSGSPYQGEWYENRLGYLSADLLTIATSEQRTGVDAELSEFGSISGRVTDTDGQPLAGVVVDVFGPPYYSTVITDPDGRYVAVGLPAGDYQIRFTPGPEYVGEWYDDEPWGGDTVTLGFAENQAGIDAELVRFGSISGRVTDESGQPLSGVSVGAIGPSGQWTVTDGDGNYHIEGVRAGDYRFLFYPVWWSGYLPEWYDDKPDETSANVVTVASEEHLGGIDAKLTLGATISGRVTGVDGAPVAGAWVTAVGSTGTFSAPTEADGTYTIVAMPAGEYRIEFVSAMDLLLLGEWYDDKPDIDSADVVTLTTSETRTGIDAQLSPKGTISGRVTDADGLPVPGVAVYAVGGPAGSGTETDNDGNYTLVGLPPGDYRVLFWTGPSSPYAEEWYADKPNFDSADIMTLGRSENRTDIDAQLGRLGSISGRVTDPDGQPLADTFVAAYGAWAYVTTRTDADGNYAVDRLPPGEYGVYVNSGSSSYLDGWFDPFTLASGEHRTGVDVQLVRAASISGRVTDPDGQPIADAWVGVQSDTHNHFLPTDADGFYHARGLPPGEYRVQVSPGGQQPYLGEWYDDKPTFETADVIILTTGEDRTGVDVQLALPGTLAGHVRGPSGKPVGGVAVDLAGAHGTTYSTTTDVDGHYAVDGVRPGSYTVAFRPSNDSWLLPTTSTTAVVGGATTDLDAQLALGGRITGKVTSSRYKAVGAVTVEVLDRSGQVVASAPVRADNTYVVYQVPPGRYVVHFVPGPGNPHRDMYWRNAKTFDKADLVRVTAGAATTKINVELNLVVRTVTVGDRPFVGGA